MSKKKSFPVFTIIFLIFLTLKLAEIGIVANWSWWKVTAPLWLPLVASLLVLVIGAIVIGIKVIATRINNKL